MGPQVQTEVMGDIHHYAWRARFRNQTVYINKRDGERFGNWTHHQCAVKAQSACCASDLQCRIKHMQGCLLLAISHQAACMLPTSVHVLLRRGWTIAGTRPCKLQQRGCQVTGLLLLLAGHAVTIHESGWHQPGSCRAQCHVGLCRRRIVWRLTQTWMWWSTLRSCVACYLLVSP